MSEPKVKKRGLSRGLDELLSGITSNLAAGNNKEGLLLELPIDCLQAGKYQPRQSMDASALQELADSIRTQGIIQPVVVRRLANDQYEIIAGERRWRAAQLAGLNEVPAIVKDVPDEAASLIALIENIQRENLSAIQEAAALQRLQDDFSMTHQEIAAAVGKSRSAVSNLLRLFNLADDVKSMLERGELEMGHARALLALPNSEQLRAARLIYAKGLSVRAAERLVRQLLSVPASASIKSIPSADIQNLQLRLADLLGARVLIQQGRKGKGKLVIQYNSLDELDGILAHIK